jgi:hypothetical protein
MGTYIQRMNPPLFSTVEHPMQVQEPDIVYSPLPAKPRTGWLYLALTLGVALYWRWSSGEWLPWPPSSVFAVLPWLLLLLSPLIVFQMGWSYALVGTELVVRRFGKERHRLGLREYQGTTMRLGYPRIRFRERAVLLISSVNDERQAFLTELQRRAHASGGGPSERVRQIDSESVRLPIALLRFPPHCVACAAAASESVRLTVQRGIDLVLFSHFQYVDLWVPACASHASRRNRARWMSWLLLLPLTLLVATILMALVPGGVWGGALVIGALISLFLVRPVQTMFGGQILDWLVLGMRATRLSEDLTEITLRCRNRATFETILKAGANGGRT